MTIGSITSANQNPPSWTRWLIPSIADLIFIALLGMLSFTTLSVRLLGDAGIGWHIRTGQRILATHAIPHADPFSSTMAGQPWFAWEWLYDVLVGLLESVAGLNAVVLISALVIALTFSWAFRLLLRRGTNFLVALILVLLAASAAMIHFFARPHVFSWLFTIVFFSILESSADKTSRRWSLWLLPLLMLAWVNIHGGFLLGFVLIAMDWIGAVWKYFRLKEDRFEDAVEKIRAGKRAAELALVGIASAIATLVNPYGWNLHLHIYRYLSNRFLMDHIDEFQSPNFHGVAQKCFAVLLLLTFVALAAKSRQARRIAPREALLVLFAVYSGLYASRNIPVSSLLLILVIAPWLSDALQGLVTRLANRAHFFQRMQAIESSLHGHVWPILAIAFTCWIAFHGGKLGTQPIMNAHFDPKRFPIASVDYLRQHDAPGPVFAPDSWGGYLIYRLYPQTKVVIDDRHDLYGEEFLKSYLKTMHVEPGWEDFLNQHPARFILAPQNSALASILAETTSWQPVHSDDVSVLFTRTSLIQTPAASQ